MNIPDVARKTADGSRFAAIRDKLRVNATNSLSLLSIGKFASASQSLAKGFQQMTLKAVRVPHDGYRACRFSACEGAIDSTITLIESPSHRSCFGQRQ
jgi:hypothetical protein